MSKKFTDEYEQYIRESAPDLWSRIEEALPEKTVSAEQKEKPKKGFWLKYGKFMSAAAAAVFMLALIPTVLSLGFLRNKDTKSAADYAAPENEMYSLAGAEKEESAQEVNQEEVKPDGEKLIQQDSFEEKKDSMEDAVSEVQAERENGQASGTDGTDAGNDGVEVKIERKDHSAYGADGAVKLECYFDLPVILEDTKAAEKINAELYRHYEETAPAMEAWRDECQDSEYSLFYFVESSVDYQGNGIISFGFHQEVWGGGGVHSVNYSYTYDLNTGEKLNLSEILGVEEGALQETLADFFGEYEAEDFLHRIEEDGEDFLYRIEEDGQVRLWVGGLDDISNVIVGKVNYGQ